MIWSILAFTAGLACGVVLAAWQFTLALDNARDIHKADDRLNPFKYYDPLV